MSNVLPIIPYETQFLDDQGVDIEAARRLRVLVLPRPFLHSADEVPESMRYAVVTSPPLSPEEQAAIVSRVLHDEELQDDLRPNEQEAMGLGFLAIHAGVQKPHLERAVKLAEHAASILGIDTARVIFNELVHNDDLQVYSVQDFDDGSSYHLDPRHYLVRL